MDEFVFIGGSWRKIQMPIDTHWSLEHRQLFAAAVIGFERRGFCEKECLILAESLLYKLLHTGLKYDRKTEAAIEGLWGRA